jgi:hypothetical protein
LKSYPIWWTFDRICILSSSWWLFSGVFFGGTGSSGGTGEVTIGPSGHALV